LIRGRLMQQSWASGSRVPLFTKQYKLVLAEDGDALRLGR